LTSEDRAVLKSKLLIALTQLLLSIFLINQVPRDMFSPTCTGANPCHACKNCKHCAKEGEKCGACK
jgi:hypothetical protein